MSHPRFAEALNGQIGYEFAAPAVRRGRRPLRRRDVPRLASFFYRQALEERNHAMMMVQYLLDADVEVVIPGVEAPGRRSPTSSSRSRWRSSRRSGSRDQINALARLAREQGDYAGEQFMQWFIKEQVEEVSSMSDLLTVVERARENPLLAEEYLARETVGDGGVSDPTAPPAAGGAL